MSQVINPMIFGGGESGIELKQVYKASVGWNYYGGASTRWTADKDYKMVIALGRCTEGGHRVLATFATNYGEATIINMRTDDYFCYDANSGGLYNPCILVNVPAGTQIKAQCNGTNTLTIWIAE